jgi:hypothetical protein
VFLLLILWFFSPVFWEPGLRVVVDEAQRERERKASTFLDKLAYPPVSISSLSCLRNPALLLSVLVC